MGGLDVIVHAGRSLEPDPAPTTAANAECRFPARGLAP